MPNQELELDVFRDLLQEIRVIGTFMRSITGFPFFEKIEVWIDKSGPALFTITPSGDGCEGGTCNHIAINNTRYDNISHHPYWPGGLFGQSNELAVSSIGIVELAAAPCALLNRSMTVQFTAAHSNLGAVSVSLAGARRTVRVQPQSGRAPGCRRELVRHRDTLGVDLQQPQAVRVPAEARRGGAANDGRAGKPSGDAVGLHRVLQGGRVVSHGSPCLAKRGDQVLGLHASTTP